MLSAARRFAVALVLCLAFPVNAVSATILGRITDAATEKPVVFATVRLLELSKEAHTDADGRYIFEGVPAGRYTVVVASSGTSEYAIGVIEVAAEDSTTLDAALRPDGAPMGDGESESEAGAAPLFIGTGSHSLRRDPIRIADMPIRGYADYIAIQPGTVRRSYGAPIHVRGGRIEEFSYSVDGFSTQDPFTGMSFAALNGNVADEIDFQSGYNHPADGWLTSGQAEVTTRETWATGGSFEAITDNFHGEKSDFTLYALDLSGSLLPNRPGQLTYLIDGELRTIGNRDPGGADDWNSLGSWHGKLNWRPADGSRIMLGTRGSYEDWKYTPRAYTFDAVHAPRGIDENYTVFGTVEQELSNRTNLSASANWFSSSHRQGDGVHFDDIWAYGRPNGNPLFDRTKLFWSWDDRLLDPDSLEHAQYVPFHSPIVESTFTVTLPGGGTEEHTFIIRGDEGSVWDDYLEQKGSYLGGRFALSHIHSREAQSQLGVEFQRHTVRAYNHLFPVNVYQGINGGFDDINRYGYDEFGAESDEDGINGAKHPLIVGSFFNEHVNWRELSLDLGARWDHFDYDTKQLVDPTNPLDPFDRAAYADTATGLSDDERNELRQSAQQLDDDELEDADPLDRLSPSLAATFAIAQNSRLLFDFGRYVQRPAFRDLYADFRFLEYKVRTGGYNYVFGNSSTEPVSVTLYEAGWEHDLTSVASFKVRAYYKDIENRLGIVGQAAVPNSYAIVGNVGDATAKGLELSAEFKRTSGLAAVVTYATSSTEERGNIFDAPNNIAWTVAAPPLVTAPVWYDQPHRIVIQADYRTGPTGGPQLGDWHPLANAGIDVLADIGSGFPYSPVRVHDEVSLTPSLGVPLGPVNSERSDWTFRIDLKANKSFPVFRADLELYVWVINLFDRENVVDVYNGTGQPDNTGWLQTTEGQQFVESWNYIHDSSFLTGEQKYELRQSDPANLDIPRQIRFGVRGGF